MQNKLSTDTVAAIDHSASQGQLQLSVMSIWEISLLAAKESIHLGQPTTDWVAKALSLKGLQLTQLTPEIAIESNQLPGNFHPDPVDRMLVATARCMGFTLLTRDKAILKYAGQGYLAAIKS
ncbi:MAG: type II toxin-antitoxin system VapC family toxin [Gammaproteobacteria bacterium]|nr:MAG: type II toxin-antitoxin system VapC family toxin [Gammaproteobacteria bacterium]